MASLKEQARDALNLVWGYESFRDGQEDIIGAILDGGDVLAIMPTGSGKSLCFQIPALLFDGCAIVVSPLMSLMHDQVARLCKLGIGAAYIDSSQKQKEQDRVIAELSAGSLKIVYVSPERLQLRSFWQAVKDVPISVLVVDEAHCVSKWGAAFRPEYMQIPEFLRSIGQRPRIAAFTATANNMTRRDIVSGLGMEDPSMFVAGFDRPNLKFLNWACKGEGDRIKVLLDLVKWYKGHSGIVYCITRRQVDEVTELLADAGASVVGYHAGMRKSEREAAQDAFMGGDCDVVVATSAFGMGIDKPDVRYVINFGMRDTLEDYYQNAGRAGRDGLPSNCILLWCNADIKLWEWIIEKSLDDMDRSSGEWERERERCFKELDKMIGYCKAKGCLRDYILRHFGDKTKGGTCGNCSSCLASEMPVNSKEKKASRGKGKQASRRKEKKRRKDYTRGSRLTDKQFDMAMEKLSAARTLDELHAAGDEIVASWPKNANGRNLYQWNKMSRYAKAREKKLKAGMEKRTSLSM